MKFVKAFALLVGLFSFFSLGAQDDFLDEPSGDRPPMNGFFDEEPEPLDEKEIVRPQSDPHNNPSAAPAEASPQNDFDLGRFPEAKRFDSGSTAKSTGKSMPALPAGNIPNRSEKLRMDFVQVDIEEIVKYFAERLQRRFIYDPSSLSGKITIISPSEVSLQEAWAAFLSALEVRGYIVFPVGSYLKLEKAANARKSPVPVYEGNTPNDDSYVTRILTLKFLNVRDVSQAVRNLLSRQGGDLIEHPQTNTLIISDYAFNIRRIIRILDVLDVEGFQEQVEIIPLRYAAAPDVARKVTDFFPTGGAGAVGGAPGATAPTTRLSRRGVSPTDAGVIQKVVADERTNALIVLGSERGIEKVKKFIIKLDIPTEGGGGKIHVYPIQNVKAEELAQTLSALTGGQKANTSRPSGIVAPLGQAGVAMPSMSETEVANLGEVKITADKATNSLVIQSSPRDFEVLKTIIRKLDIRRRQVFIEGAILEAKVGKGSSFGVQAAGPLKRVDALKGEEGQKSGVVGSLNGFGFDQLIQGALKDPSALTGMALGFRSGGTFNVDYTDASGNKQTFKLPLLSAILKLSAVNTDINILSTPHILATANEDATISIGQEIPQLAGTETTTGGNVSRNITRLRVATELNITPQINANDYLTLKIKQKINDAGEKGADGNVTTTNREATTTVIIKDQQTVVIGGLMRDRKNTLIQKVPFLGDIPILGWLFKTRSTEVEKINLLLFLTPYIIKNTGDMNDQFFRKLKEREGFLKEMGIQEQKNVPSSGLTEEQLKMLDKEYVKSLQQKFVYPKSQTSEANAENLEEKKEESKVEVKRKEQDADSEAPQAPSSKMDMTPAEINGGTPEITNGSSNSSPITSVPEITSAPEATAAPVELPPLPVVPPAPAPAISAPLTEEPKVSAPLTVPVPKAPAAAPAPATKKNSGSNGSSKDWILEDSPPEN